MKWLHWFWKVPMIIVAVPAAMIGGLFFKSPASRSPADVVRYLRDFIDGTGGGCDWDDFESVPIADPELERIRREAVQVGPPNPDLEKLRALQRQAEDLAQR